MRMNNCRRAVLALAACAAGLSLAACSGGPAATGAPAGTGTSASASGSAGSQASAGTASGSGGSGGTVSVAGSVGAFPVPSGAKVLEKIVERKETLIMLGSVSPRRVSAFYASALPAAGYTITANTPATASKTTQLAIKFTGHGYKGIVYVADNVNGTGADLGSSAGGSLLEIALTRQ
jgi:hypothetical protein